MNYREARSKYFEYYVEIEHMLKNLVNLTSDNGGDILSISTTIRILRDEKIVKLPFYHLRRQKHVRNLLAHSNRNKTVTGKHLKLMQSAKSLIWLLRKKIGEEKNKNGVSN